MIALTTTGGLLHDALSRYDTSNDGFIDVMELKLMMEKLGHPQTHVALKDMIKEVGSWFCCWL